MSVTKLYANENFPLPVVIALRALGRDVLTIQETGKAGQAISDNEVLEFAIADERAVLTFNRKHFIRLHATTPEHYGIIACTVDSAFDRLAQRIDTTIERQGELEGTLIRINRPPSPTE